MKTRSGRVQELCILTSRVVSNSLSLREKPFAQLDMFNSQKFGSFANRAAILLEAHRNHKFKRMLAVYTLLLSLLT